MYSPARRPARLSAVCTVLFLVVAGGGRHADSRSDGPSADTIVDKMIEADPIAYGGAEAQMVMVLVNNRKQQRRRRFVMKSRKNGKLRRTFVRFLKPADVSGTSFLGIDDNGNRTQYLYLPAAAKTRRISSRQRNASFVGTDYSYADLDLRDIDDAKRKRLPDAAIGGHPVYVVDTFPTHDKSAYARVRLWISKKTWLPMRMRFYNRRGTEIKRLVVKQMKKVDGRWIIAESKMMDLKRQHLTVFKVVSVKLRNDIPLQQFTVRALERG
jgi:hypothetical protein